MYKKDMRILKRGLKRMALSLITAAFFVIAVLGFIIVATAPGYLAVFLFIVSLVSLGTAFLLTYVQGLTRREYEESQGEDK